MQQLFIDYKEAYDSVSREVLYNILVEFSIPMKLLSKVSLNETYCWIRVGTHLSDTFSIRNVLKKGDALSPLLFNFGLEYVIRRVQVNQNGLKLNGMRQVPVYADVNKLDGSVHTIKKNTVCLTVTSKETGLEVSADKTSHMSRNQNAGRRH